MIFSNPEVSEYVRENFVAAWENVRSVPVVEIDFGNGEKVKRTVNGNVATYICAPDGRVVDVIPGVYEPGQYLAKLRSALALYLSSLADFEATILNHHRSARVHPAPVRTTEIKKRVDFGKAIVEQPIKKSIETMAFETDSAINRRTREPMVHAMLAERVFRPEQLTRRLYREILNVDLDDPHLGLLASAFGGGAYEPR